MADSGPGSETIDIAIESHVALGSDLAAVNESSQVMMGTFDRDVQSENNIVENEYNDNLSQGKILAINQEESQQRKKSKVSGLFAV